MLVSLYVASKYVVCLVPWLERSEAVSRGMDTERCAIFLAIMLDDFDTMNESKLEIVS